MTNTLWHWISCAICKGFGTVHGTGGATPCGACGGKGYFTTPVSAESPAITIANGSGG